MLKWTGNEREEYRDAPTASWQGMGYTPRKNFLTAINVGRVLSMQVAGAALRLNTINCSQSSQPLVHA
jgi:hypothetical protein